MTLRSQLKHTTVYLQLLITVPLLWGCSTPNVSENYIFDDTGSEGLAVVSLSYEGLKSQEAPIWRYRRVDQAGKAYIATKWAWTELDLYTPPGKLAYFALPSGEYEFYEGSFSGVSGGGGSTWTLTSAGVPTNSNPYYAGFNQPTYTGYKAVPLAVKFSIKPGKATYIGNFHFVWNAKDQKATVTLRDESKRDLELLQKRLPQLDPTAIENVAPY